MQSGAVTAPHSQSSSSQRARPVVSSSSRRAVRHAKPSWLPARRTKQPSTPQSDKLGKLIRSMRMQPELCYPLTMKFLQIKLAGCLSPRSSAILTVALTPCRKLILHLQVPHAYKKHTDTRAGGCQGIHPPCNAASCRPSLSHPPQKLTNPVRTPKS